MYWNAQIHCVTLREIVKIVLVYLSFIYCYLLNLPENEKQSKKWMATGLILFSRFLKYISERLPQEIRWDISSSWDSPV